MENGGFAARVVVVPLRAPENQVDPWRRLDAEEIRDSILAVSGNLNLKAGGPGIYPPIPKDVLAQQGTTTLRDALRNAPGISLAGAVIKQDKDATKEFYGRRVHDTCYRRPNYDAGLFVESWDDENARKGYCLYKMGCKGPVTYNSCSVVKWNEGTSYPIQSGHGCIG